MKLIANPIVAPTQHRAEGIVRPQNENVWGVEKFLAIHKPKFTTRHHDTCKPLPPVMLRAALWPEASLSLRNVYGLQLVVFDEADRQPAYCTDTASCRKGSFGHRAASG